MFSTVTGYMQRLVKYKVVVSEGYERIRIEYVINLN